MIKVAFLVSAFNPCQHYRMLEPARLYPDATFVYAPNGFKAAVLNDAAKADIVQMSYCCRPEELQAIASLHRRGVKVAVDYDDNLLQMTTSDDDRAVVAGICGLADLITVATEELAAVYRNVARHTPVAVLPNRIDVCDWAVLRRLPRTSIDRPVVIGYSGSHAHTRDFLSIADAVWKILRARQNAVLRVLGCEPFPVPADLAERVQTRSWVNVAEHRRAIADLHADIALAPLVDTPFNRSRSPLKWLQYSALHAVTIASAIPPYYGVIQDGIDGYLAADADEWEQRLLGMIDNPVVRNSIAGSAFRRVVRDFDLHSDAAARLQAYQSVL